MEDSALTPHLRIVEQEVNRAIARGAPKNLDHDELVGEANLALAKAFATGNAATRLAIRSALRDRVKYEAVRIRHGGDMVERAADFVESGIAGAIPELTERQAEAVRLVYYYGLTEAEAAGEMGCSLPMVHKILASAITSLREKLQGGGY